MNPLLQKAHKLLEKYYGYSSFREGQAKIIERILQGEDALGIMPTGGGKSICYQIPALMLPGTTLVISPLISLMKDQIDTLETMGIPATFVNSSLTYAEVEKRLYKAGRGEYKLIYIAPERLETERFVALLQTLEISFVAIDEAHCISQWGHDFRPSYRLISRLVKELPSRPIVAAFTATATPEVTQDIIDYLELHKDNVFQTGFDRANLSFAVMKGENKRDFIVDYVTKHTTQPGIIYAATRKEVDALYDFLRREGVSVGKYHAGLSDVERNDAQEKFLYDDIRVMVASNAFGMGIDKSNVRFVLHNNMPKNMESYYQEAGRAGRDGEPSECVLLFSPQDIIIQKFLIEQNTLSPERKAGEYKKLQTMVNYCHTTGCLRHYIVNYFGDKDAPTFCGNCGSCSDDGDTADITLIAQKIFSCILRMRERYGVTMVAQVLRGSRSKKVIEWGFERLPTFGLLKELPEKQISDLIHVLVAEGYVMLTEGQYPVVKLLTKASTVLKGEATVVHKQRTGSGSQGSNATGRTAASRGSSRGAFKGSSSSESASKRSRWGQEGEWQDESNDGFTEMGMDGAENEALFEQLRTLRKEIAQHEKVPPYIIFPDSTLREMTELRPHNEKMMLRIKGVGETKFNKYGVLFLEVIRQA